MAMMEDCRICNKPMYTGQDLTFDERFPLWFHSFCYNEKEIACKEVVIHPSLNKVAVGLPPDPEVHPPLKFK